MKVDESMISVVLEGAESRAQSRWNGAHSEQPKWICAGKAKSDEPRAISRVSLTASLLDLEQVHEHAEHDDRDSRPDIDAQSLLHRILHLWEGVGESVRREGKHAVCEEGEVERSQLPRLLGKANRLGSTEGTHRWRRQCVSLRRAGSSSLQQCS